MVLAGLRRPCMLTKPSSRDVLINFLTQHGLVYSEPGAGTISVRSKAGRMTHIQVGDDRYTWDEPQQVSVPLGIPKVGRASLHRDDLSGDPSPSALAALDYWANVVNSAVWVSQE